MTRTQIPALSSHAATVATAPRTRTTNLLEAARQGLYRPEREHDACGVGFVADINNKPRHEIVEQGLQILVNLTHRGAVGADPEMGDGAGMLVQLPHRLFAEEAERIGFTLPEKGHYGVGMVFFPREGGEERRRIIEEVVAAEGQRFLGWREVPVNSACLSASVQASEPVVAQFFVGRGEGIADDTHFERRLFILRKVISNSVYTGLPPAETGFVICSLSCRTMRSSKGHVSSPTSSG